MQVAGCSCRGRLGNSGIPSVKPFGITSGFIFVPILADDGTRNGLDLSSTTLEADILALINNPDPSKRGYLYQDLRNVTHTEADATYQTADNGERFKLRDGIKTVEFQVWDVPNQYYKKTSEACVQFGLYAIDVCGNLKGEKEGDFLYPRVVNNSSFNSMFIDATADEGARVNFMMDYSILSNDGDQWMIGASEFGANSPLSLRSIIDVVFTVVDVTDASNFVVDAELCYGDAVSPLVWRGGVLADFTLVNATTGAAIALTDVTESTLVNGRYNVEVTAPIVDDTSVTLSAFKAATGPLLNGYEGEELTFSYDFT